MQQPSLPSLPRGPVAVIIILVVLDCLEPPLASHVGDQGLDQVQVDLVGVLSGLVLLEGLGGSGSDVERRGGGGCRCVFFFFFFRVSFF